MQRSASPWHAASAQHRRRRKALLFHLRAGVPDGGQPARDEVFIVHVQGYQNDSVADMQVSDAPLYRAYRET
jgi:hypothetical protein